ncbi:sensor domain-containing diguanylate cyclase [Lysobacter sp. TY2-98]|uniref:sensor domain-containing diguanylate cyclase n=1 Tax=Lysobacter sp. TY2-98 TaxID=2290922 RepID=UPI0013B4413F|nr:sensor domain-containing diguanylate cyclase [Lysobacter sp. TY2-98]
MLTPGRPRGERGLPWIASSSKDSEILRLRGLVATLASVAEHPGGAQSFVEYALDKVVEITRATGGVVLLDNGDAGLTVASARGQMTRLDVDAFNGGQTLARACLEEGTSLRSDATAGDERIRGDARRRHHLHALIAAPLRYGDTAQGVLEICSSVTHAFDDIDAQAIALIGNAMGGALGRQLALEENARLLRRLHDALLDTQATAQMYQDAASLDALTSLPNRATFEAQLEAVCAAHDGQPHRFGVLFIDLDDFKDINDSYGHATGDAVLRTTAGVLRDTLRDTDVVARLGGDEFVVLLSSLRDADRDVRSVAAAVEDELARPRVVNGVRLRIKCSVGWVIHDGESHASQVLHTADERMYEQKRARRQR